MLLDMLLNMLLNMLFNFGFGEVWLNQGSGMTNCFLQHSNRQSEILIYRHGIKNINNNRKSILYKEFQITSILPAHACDM